MIVFFTLRVFATVVGAKYVYWYDRAWVCLLLIGLYFHAVDHGDSPFTMYTLEGRRIPDLV